MRQLVTSNKVTLTNTLLIDGNYLLKRSISATANKVEYHTKGGSMGGVYQFMITLRKLITDFGANKVIICWDGDNGGKLRYDMYRGYKANRPSKSWYSEKTLTPAQIKDEERTKRSTLAQRIRIQQYCEELYMRQLEVELIEADDLIAYYCRKYHPNERITIFTNDRDMCQLLAYDNVHIFLSNKKVLVNKENYFLHFPHHYTNAALMKVMTGDTSDNIFGVVGLEDKTLLKHFPELRTQKLDYHFIVKKAGQINQERTTSKPKKKPLKVLENIVNGVTLNYLTKKPETKGEDLYILNSKLVNLMTPLINREAITDIIATCEHALDSGNRGSKYLLPMMEQDEFLKLFNGPFTRFFEPFLPTILKEKEFETQANLNTL